ncbi:uncharacterized protein LTR77_005824 [Saxophila tyrrhenica]|uniref:Uncharacterized protein n=1 Tax=Saxophila tyrrhenica TaxID=1690608 RepID=A0AAV9P9I1_9PEZI|nr:hypothetical protein LTR77_005824 [Saxophila tyrrhenica]
MSSSTGDKISDVDIILNRINVAHARSQRLLQSWLPPKQEQEPTSESREDDEDFRSMTEVGGYGSKAAYAEDAATDGLIPRKKTTSNDMLLEQILGKKGAQAKRKKDAEKSGDKSAVKFGASKPLQKSKEDSKAHVESEDEEGGGRASAFKSRKARRTGEDGAQSNVSHKDDVTQSETLPTAEDTTPAKVKDSDLEDGGEDDVRPTKRKKASYLDEVLAQKSKKKKKKKNKQSANDAAV